MTRVKILADVEAIDYDEWAWSVSELYPAPKGGTPAMRSLTPDGPLYEERIVASGVERTRAEANRMASAELAARA